MPDTSTVNYSFILPEIGASDDTWGGKLNDNWTQLDAILGSTFKGQNPVVDIFWGDQKNVFDYNVTTNVSALRFGMGAPAVSTVLNGSAAQFVANTNDAEAIAYVELLSHPGPVGSTVTSEKRFMFKESGPAGVNDDLVMRYRDIVDLFFPVSHVMLTYDDVNPGTRIPGTTWVSMPQNRALVVAGAAYSGGEQFGAGNFTLNANHLPAHTHPMSHTHNIAHQHNGPSHRHLNNPPNTNINSVGHTHAAGGLTIANAAPTQYFDLPGTNGAGGGSFVIDTSGVAPQVGPWAYSLDARGDDYGRWRVNLTVSHSHGISGSTGAQSANHVHAIPDFWSGFEGTGQTTGGPTNSGASSIANTGSAGLGTAVPYIPFSVGVYAWRRTA